MTQNKNYFCIIFLVFLSSSCFAQEKNNDAIKTNDLEEVVVTGQYNPQSIKKSIYNVIVIKREQIENQAANNLADLLNFKLNLNIIPNSQTGKSTISFFGLDAQYFNILIDNIPLVSDTGLGNNIDLTQINLDDIERIEIIEGATGVEYGANAISGVINIITKKSMRSKWNIKTKVQEESVSNEYGWFDKGRHIQGFNISHNFKKSFFVRLLANRNQFAGFFNNKKGKNYYKNDGLRGYNWLPKTQLNTNALLSYRKETFNVLYKLEYFNQILNKYDASVRANIDTQTQTSNPSATDKIFTTNRFVNNLHINGNLNSGANYNFALSYQNQKRLLNTFNYYILSKEKTNETDGVYQSSEVFFSKGRINNLVKNDVFNFQLGYETRLMKGFDNQASGDITQKPKTQKQNNFAIFGSSELKLSKTFLFRPALRYQYNSKFKYKLLTSLSTRYLMHKGFELRANIGTSYRTPNFQELFYYFVDSNHDVTGNKNLNPEKGFTTSINLKKQSRLKNIRLQNTLKFNYIDVQDKINLAIVNTSPLQYKYINIDHYRLWGMTLKNSLKIKALTFNLGATLQGISRSINNEITPQDNFLYNVQINTSGNYQIKKWQTAVTVLLKYNGKQQNYVSDGIDSNGNTIYKKTTTNPYSWLNTSIRKAFFNKKVQVTLGARNLLNITNVNIRNASTGGTHSSNNNSLLLGYGRSFYLKLLYNINF